jgi:hypothetical protein
MAQRYYTEDEMRKRFDQLINGRTQHKVAAEIGIKRQQVNAMIRGEQLSAKVLAWMGYQKVQGVYEKVK